jgi:hypothetical protein
MCCGEKRSQLQTSQAQRTARSTSQYVSGNSQGQAVQPLPPAPTSTPHSSIVICYLETSPVRVQGLITGRCYEFSGSQTVQSVDARDASSLLNTRFFRRV